MIGVHFSVHSSRYWDLRFIIPFPVLIFASQGHLYIMDIKYIDVSYDVTKCLYTVRLQHSLFHYSQTSRICGSQNVTCFYICGPVLRVFTGFCVSVVFRVFAAVFIVFLTCLYICGPMLHLFMVFHRCIHVLFFFSPASTFAARCFTYSRFF